MAVHHDATIVPTKIELLQAWVPHQPWAAGTDTSALTRLGSYRFDDPDGAVGMETHLLGTADGRVLQVPLTYRGAPRAGAEQSLVTTMAHTTLGERWVYDGCHDPVYVTAMVSTILTGGREADLFLATADGMVLQPPSARVRGSGSPSGELPALTEPRVGHDGALTRIDAGPTLTLLRVPAASGSARPAVTGATLTGSWPGQPEPVLLAVVG